MKKVVQCFVAILIFVVVFLAGAFIRLGIRTNNINEDYKYRARKPLPMKSVVG
ncbi:hypothetical protein [Butyrivibrio sp.]|uniref:hypothetical protein n=1 Tax=Butyrivibrio sp. TaxID=28121 RepID=UPI0025B8BC64|nr:hypothetical protein [Butyrivibrio sp.]MBQ9303776.1 hypothetical protein [Butyrivibrio sp.]